MHIQTVFELVADDMQAVNECILHHLHSDIVLINQIGGHIVNSGGKRLRPLLVLLAARGLNYKGQDQINLAAIIEFIHTATLLHDDVVDDSEQRRHQETANHMWGNAASVLVGDFLYSRSFEMMVRLNHMRVMEILAHATNRIAEGEVLQLMNCHNPDIDEARYLDTIERKTATLFEAGGRLAAVIAHVNSALENALATYGLELGIAFQIIDDLLDYTGEDIGKNIGDDLEEGKPTLPLLRALQVGDAKQRALLSQTITSGGREHIQEIMQVIESTDAIPYTSARANEHAHKARLALNVLPPSKYRDALDSLAEFTVQRAY